VSGRLGEAGSLRYRVYRPGPPLAAAVEYLWYLSDAPAHARELVVPSGTLELVVNLHEDAIGVDGDRRFAGAVVSGCYGRPFAIDTRAHAAIIGVHFRPGGAAGLLGAPPGELADDHVGLDALWGPGAARLRERLCAADGLRDRFCLLEAALLRRLGRGRPARDAVRAALPRLDEPGVAIGAVSAELGLSRRRFIEVFTDDVGMTPKRYARVRRFQRSLALAQASPAPAWSALALACGYFDQAHLCRDWAELAGASPREVLARRATPAKENHVAVPAAGSNPSKTRPPSSRTVRRSGGHDVPTNP
jgi:AraC-like DNA-binding protein